MDQYANFTLRDFIQDPSFIRWVKFPTSESNAFWEAVRATHPHQATVMERAALLVEGLASFHPDVAQSEVDKGRQKVMSRLHEPKISISSRRRIYFAVAASLLVLLGLLWHGQDRPQPLYDGIANVHQNEESIINEGTDPKKVILPEGSVITLSPKSQIKYEMRMKGQRQVFLEGEAFFDVTKNPDRPFLVLANGLITKVLGTRFKVSAYNDGTEVKVEVNSGRVKVYSMENGKDDPESEGIILTPNQKVVYRKKDMSFTRLVVENPQLIITPQNIDQYTYTDTPISEIFDGLEQLYGIKVHYDKKVFKDCRLNMVLTDESLFEKLELIGKVVEGRYNVIDGQVFFIGAGCSEN